MHLKKKICSVLEKKESKNALNYRKKVEEAEATFGVKEKVFNRNTDNEDTMRAALKDNERNGCYMQIASKSHRKALKNQATLKLVRGKFRKIVKKS